MTDAEEVISRLQQVSGEVPISLEQQILALGDSAVDPLISLLDEDADTDAARYALRLLSVLSGTRAVEEMYLALSRSDVAGDLYERLVAAIAALGERALEPGLAVHARVAGEARQSVREALSELGVRDERVYRVLESELEANPSFGADLLGRYGDARALPRLSAELDRQVITGGDQLSNDGILQLRASIEELGGTLTPEQREKVREVDELPVAVDLDDLADPFAVGEEAQLERFAAAFPNVDSAWVELMFRHALDYLDATFDTFDGDVLETVVFELFPEKVSCSPGDAPEIIEALRAYWTFARDELKHPGAASCLAALDEDAVDELEAELDDAENYGMAKAFVMQGRAEGFEVDTEAGMAEWVAAANAARAATAQKTSKDEKAKKKKLKKQKKKAQRRNRR